MCTRFDKSRTEPNTSKGRGAALDTFARRGARVHRKLCDGDGDGARGDESVDSRYVLDDLDQLFGR